MHLPILIRLKARLSHLLGFLKSDDREDRLDDEIRFHLEMQTEKNLTRGMSPDEARRAAAVAFGGCGQWREASRDEYRSRPLDDLSQDLRYAARTLRSAPGFTIVAVLTLAIGIGGNTAIFSAVDGVLLKALPFSEPDRVVAIRGFDRRKGPRTALSPANFADLRERSTAFSGVAAAEPFGLTLRGSEGEEEVGAWNVTEDFFTVLDARPVIGRLLQREDYAGGAKPVVVLTYKGWQKRFGGDPSVIGKVMTMSHRPTTIVGVLPFGFAYLDNPHFELFSPKVLDASERALRSADFYQVAGRLKPGVSLEQAAADLNRVQAQLARDFPKTNANVDVVVLPLRDAIVGDASHTLLLLLGAVGLVLLIACANVANLMLARTMRRSREFAVRAALGAGRARIARQVLAESFLIALVGGVAGAALAYWGVGAIRALSPGSLARVDQIRVDLRALTFALGAVVLTTFVFGVVPALRAAQPASQEELKGGGRTTASRRQHRLRGALVAAEVALAVVLLIGAGLLVRSFAAVVGQERGYRPERVLAATVFVWEWNRTPAAREQFIARTVERLRAIPGVTAAGATSSLPLGGAIGAADSPIRIVGQPVPAGQEPREHVTALTPGTFEALGMGLRRGRLFTGDDNAASLQVAVINEAMARRYWPNGNPLGKRVAVGLYSAPIEREVVGVVADVRQQALDTPAEPIVYLPHAQAPAGAMSLVLRAAVDPATLGRDVKRAVTELNPELPVASMQTLESVVDESLRPRRFTLLLLGCFSAAALALAVVGVYGVISQATTERVREFGLRIALGAQSYDIIRMVMRQGVGAAAIGTLVGVAASAGAAPSLERMLFGVSSSDPLTLAAVCALMLVTAMIACYLPARRAAKSDALVSLRNG